MVSVREWRNAQVRNVGQCRAASGCSCWWWRGSGVGPELLGYNFFYCTKDGWSCSYALSLLPHPRVFFRFRTRAKGRNLGDVRLRVPPSGTRLLRHPMNTGNRYGNQRVLGNRATVACAKSKGHVHALVDDGGHEVRGHPREKQHRWRRPVS